MQLKEICYILKQTNVQILNLRYISLIFLLGKGRWDIMFIKLFCGGDGNFLIVKFNYSFIFNCREVEKNKRQ